MMKSPNSFPPVVRWVRRHGTAMGDVPLVGVTVSHVEAVTSKS